MKSAITPFLFDSQTIRVLTVNNAPWFVAKDVAEALEYANSSNPARLLTHVPDEWKGVNPIHTLGGIQEMLTLSEPGLYFFVNRSDKPKALPFQKWIAGDVLPEIRKTGSYSLTSDATIAGQPRLHFALRGALRAFDLAKDAWGKQVAANQIKVLCAHLSIDVPDFALIGKPIDQYQLEV